jgi:predicted ribosomally synthesized peptide with nif11-like leader
MSEEQLRALLAKLKDDARLQEKLKGAADLDAFVALAQEAGFDVSKADWLRYQANQMLELSDEDLEGVAGSLGAVFDNSLLKMGTASCFGPLCVMCMIPTKRSTFCDACTSNGAQYCNTDF